MKVGSTIKRMSNKDAIKIDSLEFGQIEIVETITSCSVRVQCVSITDLSEITRDHNVTALEAITK